MTSLHDFIFDPCGYETGFTRSLREVGSASSASKSPNAGGAFASSRESQADILMRSVPYRRTTVVSAVVLVLLVSGIGYFLFGPLAALGFCAFFGIAIYTAARWILRRGKARRSERRSSIAVITVAAILGVLVGVDCYRKGLHQVQRRVREAKRLESELRSSTEFELVIISYHAPPLQDDERLSVSGYVARPGDLERLHDKVYTGKNWKVEWDVGVMDH